MTVGIPAKKPVFCLARDYEGVVSCVLNESSLYVLYSSRTSEGEGFVRAFNLDEFDGREDLLPKLCVRSKDSVWRDCFYLDGHLYVYGKRPELIDVSSFEAVYSEHVGKASADWSDAGRFFFNQGRIFRNFDTTEFSKGLDIVENCNVVGHMDLDVEFNGPFPDDLVYGFSQIRSSFCIYSLASNALVLEIGIDKYRVANLPIKKSISRSGSKLYVLVGCSVLLIDLELNVLISEFNYFDTDFFKEVISERGVSHPVLPYRISACEGGAVITNASSDGLIMYLGWNGVSLSLLWARKAASAIYAENTAGDLIYGIEARKPRAWDKFTGVEVWQASVGTTGNTINIGGSWVVYSQMSGDIQCFAWKKPYLSPHRPS